MDAEAAYLEVGAQSTDPNTDYMQLEDGEDHIPQPRSRGMSKRTRWALIGGGAVIATVVLIVVIVVATTSSHKDHHDHHPSSTCQKGQDFCECDEHSVCTCREGYAGDGIKCLAPPNPNMPLCQKDLPHCTTCNGPACNCDPEYRGDGKNCLKPPDPTKPLCEKTKEHCGACTNTGEASDGCNCDAGYVGDGEDCYAPPHPDWPLCEKRKPNCGLCEGPACNCDVGYVGDGTDCFAPPHPDKPMCDKTKPDCEDCNGPACNCRAGYVGDGTNCFAPPHPDQPMCDKTKAHCTVCSGPACNCEAGYIGDGTDCFAPPHPDKPLCEKTKEHCTDCNGPACNCETGYVGDGTNCLAPPHPDQPLCDKTKPHCTVCDGDACNCEAGYVGDGTECFAPPHPDQPMCDKTKDHCTDCNGPACNCETGYVGDGTDCFAPPHPDKPLCDKTKEHCTDCNGPACNCETGYVGDGTNCLAPPHPDQPLCDKTKPHCTVCDGDACNCETGYVGDGTECFAPPHPEAPMCIKTKPHCTDCNGPACNCEAGYVSDGTECFAPPHPDKPLCDKTKDKCTDCNGPACNCATGYVGDGTDCFAPPHPDQPLCEEGRPHCTVCNGPACNCETDYVGDGTNCTAVIPTHIPFPDLPPCTKTQPHCTVCNAAGCNCEAGFVSDGDACSVDAFGETVLSMVDDTQDACVDWREYACGAWMAKTPVPGPNCLNEGSCENVEMFSTLGDLVYNTELKGSVMNVEGPAKDVFSLCMDEATIAQEGMAQVRSLLEPIKAATTKWEVVKACAPMTLFPFHHISIQEVVTDVVDPKTGEVVHNMTLKLPSLTLGLMYEYNDESVWFANESVAIPYIKQALDDMEIDGDHDALANQIYHMLMFQPFFYPSHPSSVSVDDLQDLLKTHELEDAWDWNELFSFSYNTSQPYFAVGVGKDVENWYKGVEFYNNSASLESLKALTSFILYGMASTILPDVIPAPPAQNSAVKTDLEEDVYQIMARAREGLLSRHEMQHELMKCMSRHLGRARHVFARMRVQQRWARLNSVFHLDSLMPKPLPEHVGSVEDLLAHLLKDEPTERQMFCFNHVNSLGLVDKPFLEMANWTQESKDRAMDMMHAVKKALKEHINSMAWMDTTTKAAALKKLEYLQMNAGFPDVLPDPSVGVNMTRGFLPVTLDIMLNSLDKIFTRLGAYPDFRFWMWNSGIITTTTINAMYMPSYNTITVPAAILQLKVFGGTNPAAMNFGAAGAIIGHELTHGFDNSGKNYDEYGRERNWWTPASEAEFDTRANCLADQYSSYTCCTPQVNITGQFCLGENIADNGGMRASYLAMKELIVAHPEQRNPANSSLEVKWTDEEMFFVSWAQCWCSVYNATGMSEFITKHEDVHSPGFIRTFAPMRNMEEFADVHKCDAGDFMDPTKRCVLF